MPERRQMAQTRITRQQLTEAQGGIDPTEDQTLVWVECPADYDADAITAEDIVRDPAVRAREVPEDESPDQMPPSARIDLVNQLRAPNIPPRVFEACARRLKAVLNRREQLDPLVAVTIAFHEASAELDQTSRDLAYMKVQAHEQAREDLSTLTAVDAEEVRATLLEGRQTLARVAERMDNWHDQVGPYEDHPPPLVAGGQGRSAEDVTADALALMRGIGYGLGLLAVALVVAGVITLLKGGW